MAFEMKEGFDEAVELLLDAGMFLGQSVEILEQSMIQRAMDRAGGNRTNAAKMLGIHRNTLQSKLAQFGIGSARTKPPAREVRGRTQSRPRRASSR
jgi:DNA-binding NtrC family response regulator